jgi:hypothetical protein
MTSREMEASQQKLGWSAVTLWVIASIVAWAMQWAPFPGGNSMLSLVESSSGYDPAPWGLYVVGGVMAGAISGSILGVSQWFILRGVISGAALWAVLTIVAMAMGQGAGSLLSKTWIVLFRAANNVGVGEELASPDAVQMVTQSAALYYLPVGFALGLLQWAVLRKSLRLAWLWLLISLAVWPTAAAVYWMLYGVLGGPLCQSWSCLFDPPGPGYYPASIVAWLAGGLVVGVVTGVTLRKLVSTRIGPREQGAMNQASVQETGQT